jgi:hypothetical protein
MNLDLEKMKVILEKQIIEAEVKTIHEVGKLIHLLEK